MNLYDDPYMEKVARVLNWPHLFWRVYMGPAK